MVFDEMGLSLVGWPSEASHTKFHPELLTPESQTMNRVDAPQAARIIVFASLAPMLAVPFFSVSGEAAPPSLMRPDPLKHLVFDRRVVASTEGLRLVPGRVEKEAKNPLFQADRPWEEDGA
jgi:hypothetical protein